MPAHGTLGHAPGCPDGSLRKPWKRWKAFVGKGLRPVGAAANWGCSARCSVAEEPPGERFGVRGLCGGLLTFGIVAVWCATLGRDLRGTFQ